MVNMAEGNVTKQMLSFAAPLLLGNILQQLYSTTDAIIVGKFAGTAALAAIGTSTPIMNILLFSMFGLALGASVLLSEFFGASEYEKLKEEEMTAILSGLIFTVFLSIVGYILTKPLLLLIHTPAGILPQAETYLHIIALGLVFSFLYNILASALRSIGDSRTPVAILIFSSLLNIALSVLFVKQFGLGVRGSALGTLISQAVSALLCIVYIYWKVPILQLNLRKLKINLFFLSQTARYSSVSAIQQTIVYVGILFLQGAVNPLGVDTIAAYNAVSKIDGFLIAPADSLALSLTTFTSQNRGADKPDRIRKGMKSCALISITYCASMAAIAFFAARNLIALFLNSSETAAISIGIQYVHVMAFCYLILAFADSFLGLFRGLGRMDITLWATLIQIPLRVMIAYTLVGSLGMPAVAIGVGTGWLCMSGYELFLYRKYLHQKLVLG